ncbi:MAG: ABC transporter substrate-binding protein, partial [Candidatus Lokiarchaeota archaeon]
MKIKKVFLISIVLFILILPVIHNINYLFPSPILDEEGNHVKTSQTSLIFGIAADPITIDPITCMDANSDPYIRQVAETLFWNNISDSNYPLEPLLVDTYSWDVTGKNLTLNLRSNIYFHDGYIFNASAVKWNVERWLYLTNATGLLPSGPVASPSPLYFFSNGTSIINRSEIVSEFSAKIILNHPFSPFLSFLSYISNAIISPYSHSQTAYIDLTTGDLIGTGPFMFNYYTSSVEARFDRYNNYWRGPSSIETLIFAINSNYDARMNSLLDHDVDIVNSIDTGYLNQFIADPNITLYDAGPDLIYRYYGFNNDNVNITWRKALSYTINYSYIIEDYRGGGASRGYPAVPEGIPGHNSSVQANLPFLNRTYARILMQTMGFGTTFDIYNDAEWLSQATSSPFRDFNLLGYLGSQLNRDLFDIFTDNVEYIGCSTTQTLSTDLSVYLTALKTYPNSYDVHYFGWAPYYPDAYNMLYSIFYSNSTENTAQVDIPVVDSFLDSSVTETDEPTRLDYFKQVQYILFEQEFVHAPLFADRAYFAHLSDLNGLPYNPFKYYYFYNCSKPYLGPESFILESDAGDPDLDGTFLLNWTDSERASYYTVYYDTEFILEIN